MFGTFGTAKMFWDVRLQQRTSMDTGGFGGGDAKLYTEAVSRVTRDRGDVM